MSSFEKQSPGIKPLFFSQKMAQNDPEKNIPSTAANATNLSGKDFELVIHLMAQSALSFIKSMVSIALKRRVRSVWSLIKVSINRP